MELEDTRSEFEEGHIKKIWLLPRQLEQQKLHPLSQVQTEDSKPQFQKTRTNNTLPGRTNMLNMESMTCVDIQIKDSNEAEVD